MCYLKLFKLFNPSQELVIWNFQMTWNEMCYLKLFKLFNPSQGLVIWNFQIRLEVRCVIWNFSTFSNPSWELLIWNFQVRLEKEVLFETFETWNFSNPSWGGCLFESFRWDLKKRCYLKCLKLETFQTCHGGFFIWNFQMRLEMRCAIWNFSTFSNPSQELLIWNFQMTWNKICYLKCLKLETFQTCHGGCLFETFRWDLKWDVLFETFQSFQPITGVGYLKLSDKTWKRGAIWNFSKFSTHHRSWLFETFR